MNDYNKYDDNQLIALLREAKPMCNQAFNVLYYRYSEKIKSFCLFKTSNKEEASEIFQETWLRFHQQVIKGKNDINLPQYLYGIAFNLINERFRSKDAKVSYYANEVVLETLLESFDLQLNVENRELLEIINLAIIELPAEQRDVFVLKWFSGLKYTEIAEILNESTDCVKQRNQRALANVIKTLKPVINDINLRKGVKNG